jgi:hypothetical protein
MTTKLQEERDMLLVALKAMLNADRNKDIKGMPGSPIELARAAIAKVEQEHPVLEPEYQSDVQAAAGGMTQTAIE